MDEGSVSDAGELPPTSEMFEARQFNTLGRVIFDTEQDEFAADLELRAAPDFPESLKMLFVDPQLHSLRIEALVHRPDGTFLLVYRYSSRGGEQADGNQAAKVAPFSTPEWGFCTVSPLAYYHIDAWFDRKDLQIRRAKALVENGLDDERVAVARLEALKARKIDAESVITERKGLLHGNGLDDESVTEKRKACLKEHALDPDSIERARIKLIDEMAWGDEDIARRVKRELESLGLDDDGIARRRAELFEENGLV